MTQDERWHTRCDEVKSFILANKRNSSKYRVEEHDYLNWLKAKRKRMNSGELSEPRLSKFRELLALVEEYKRVNQWC